MNLKFLFIDNLIVASLSFIIAFLLFLVLPFKGYAAFFYYIFSIGILVVLLGFMFTMIRFWHTPKRKITAGENEIVSPADGNVIYINKIEATDIPYSIKKGNSIKLEEFTKTKLLNTPCWQIGINMTPWDVHKNCSPIDGEIILNEHHQGSFFSLKNSKSLIGNERNTYVIENEKNRIGVVQIASKRVRRIDSYVKIGDVVKKGDWIGMIRFGSQVDIFFPVEYIPIVELGNQIYAGSTVIAILKN
jgi:phosphatidylserine decarboxylase